MPVQRINLMDQLYRESYHRFTEPYADSPSTISKVAHNSYSKGMHGLVSETSILFWQDRPGEAKK